MIPQFNSIIVDVVLVVLFLSVLLYGALKGLKHTLINFILFAGSIVLAFTSVVSPLKMYVIDFISAMVNFSAATAAEVKLGVSMCYTFIASVVLALAFYIVLRFLKFIVCVIVKKYRVKKGKEIKYPRKGSRFFGAIFSLALNGSIVLIMLLLFANPLVGGDKTILHSRLTDIVELNTTKVIKAISGDDLIEEKIIIKSLKGDFFLENVKDEDAKMFATVANVINEKDLKNFNLGEVQSTVDSLYSLLYLMEKYAIDEKGVELSGFQHFVKYGRKLISETVNLINTNKPEGKLMEAENTFIVSSLLRKVGLSETAETFEEMFEMK